VLKRELGYDNRRANETIDAMTRVGTLQYHHPMHDNPRGLIEAPPGGTGPAGTPTVAGYAGAPVSDRLLGISYWQIGHGEGDEAPGRAGRVTPH
jgi:hypothetical protein